MPKGKGPFARAITGAKKVQLDDIDPGQTDGLDKAGAHERLEELGAELAELTNLLVYAGKQALLVIFQGRDASGKDGAIRKILEYGNVLGSSVHAFKAPTEEERGHDFLWRVHRVTPRRGRIALFNRSHYEDVVAVRVHELMPKLVWKKRFRQINQFEETLLASDTIVLKFFLHVSRQEQYERLIERERDPRTAWKLNVNDWRELPLWDRTTAAYEDVLAKCSPAACPWYVVPADRKWFRNLAVVDRIVRTLRPYRKPWLQSLEKLREAALTEIEALRTSGAAFVRRTSPRKRGSQTLRGFATIRPTRGGGRGGTSR